MKIIDPLIHFVTILLFVVLVFSIISFFGFIVSEHKKSENVINVIELQSVDALKDENELNSIIDHLQSNNEVILKLNTNQDVE